MDSATIAYIVSGLVALLSSGLLIFVQRELKKSDTADEKTAKEIDARFGEQGRRLGDLSDKHQRLELSLVNKVDQEKLDKLYEKLDDVKREWKEDLKDMKGELLTAINTHKG